MALHKLRRLITHSPAILRHSLPPQSQSTSPTRTARPLTSPSGRRTYDKRRTTEAYRRVEARKEGQQVLSRSSSFQNGFQVIRRLKARGIPGQPRTYIRNGGARPEPDGMYFIVGRGVHGVQVP